MEERNAFDPECITYSQMNLIFNSRIYYRRLTTWTWAYIIGRYFGIGTAEDLFERLYIESIELGDMLQIIFGREYSEEYRQLLSQFPIAFREIISAQLDGDTEAMNQNIERLYRNIDERAAYLEELNPYWSEEEYISLFETYIQYIFEIVNSIVTDDYNRTIEIYDPFVAHTNRMGDVFAEGLYCYISSGVGSEYQSLEDVECITYDEMNEIYDIRMVWFELETWTRNYFISRYLGIGNEDEVFNRLSRVFDDYINTMRLIYGEEFALKSQELLYEYLELLRAYIDAQIQGNTSELDRLVPLLYQNAEERAVLVSSVNPVWDEAEWRNRQRMNLQYTIEESVGFLAGDYARSINIFSRLLDLAESTSNFLAEGLFNYFFTQSSREE